MGCADPSGAPGLHAALQRMSESGVATVQMGDAANDTMEGTYQQQSSGVLLLTYTGGVHYVHNGWKIYGPSLKKKLCSTLSPYVRLHPQAKCCVSLL